MFHEPPLAREASSGTFRRTNLIVKLLDSPIALSEKFNLLLGKVAYDHVATYVVVYYQVLLW